MAAPGGLTFYPAIDILDGRAVRLTQGDFGRSKAYADNPSEAAARFEAEGARALHAVDLEGARGGRPAALDHLRRIATAVSIPVQWGGGLRSLDHLRQALEAGASRVVLGTAAFTNATLVDEAAAELGERLVVSVDVRSGRVATSGWLEQAERGGEDAVRGLRSHGVGRFVYTNIDRDGMLSGPDPDEVRRVSTAVGEALFIYSGGIGSLEDLRLLARLALPNLDGVIAGKALYEKRFTVAEALSTLAGSDAEAEVPTSS
jgi:phosphoribosylformimino-5-aminoimidazole carboxamide ribotide isomerase